MPHLNVKDVFEYVLLLMHVKGVAIIFVQIQNNTILLPPVPEISTFFVRPQHTRQNIVSYLRNTKIQLLKN